MIVQKHVLASYRWPPAYGSLFIHILAALKAYRFLYMLICDNERISLASFRYFLAAPMRILGIFSHPLWFGGTNFRPDEPSLPFTRYLLDR